MDEIEKLDLNSKYLHRLLMNIESTGNYDEIIYLLKMKDCSYVGNMQVDSSFNSTEAKELQMIYWFDGYSDDIMFEKLHVFHGVGNKNKANQKILNEAKSEIIDVLKPTMNIQILPNNTDLIKKYGCQILEYKNQIKQLFYLNIYEISKYIVDIINWIFGDFNNRFNFLLNQNRYSIAEGKNKQFDGLNESHRYLIVLLKNIILFMVWDCMNNSEKRNKMVYNLTSKWRNFIVYKKLTGNINKLLQPDTEYIQLRLITSLMYMKETMALDYIWKRYISFENKYINQ